MKIQDLKQFLSRINSSKTAVIHILSIVFFIFIHYLDFRVFEKITINQLPETLMFIFSIAFAIVIVDIALWIMEKCGHAYQSRQLKKGRFLKTRNFIYAVQAVFPHLPNEQIDLLKKLEKDDEALDIRKSNVTYLEHQKLIERYYQVSRNIYIYKINPLIRRIFRQFIVSRLSAEELTFLGLFFIERISQGTENSRSKMKYATFMAGQNLVRDGILDNPRIASKEDVISEFTLGSGFRSLLETEVFKADAMREKVILNDNYICGPGSTGDGAHNLNYIPIHLHLRDDLVTGTKRSINKVA